MDPQKLKIATNTLYLRCEAELLKYPINVGSKNQKQVYLSGLLNASYFSLEEQEYNINSCFEELKSKHGLRRKPGDAGSSHKRIRLENAPVVETSMDAAISAAASVAAVDASAARAAKTLAHIDAILNTTTTTTTTTTTNNNNNDNSDVDDDDDNDYVGGDDENLAVRGALEIDPVESPSENDDKSIDD